MSKLADYGTVIMTTMARYPEKVQSAADISAASHLPVPTVSKILKTLTREGLVVSLRGAHGGYMIARPATEISVIEIIVAMDGPIGMTECTVTPGTCPQEATCPIRPNWQHVNRMVLNTLRQVTLDQMLRPPPAEPTNISALKLRRPSPANASPAKAVTANP
jgi:FeS assembly SUF system regulator